MPIARSRSLSTSPAGALLGALLVLSAAVDASAQALQLAWSGNRVSIAAVDVPLAAILTDLARHTGSAVVGLEKASDPVTIDLDKVTLHDALRTLLADKNYIYLDRPAAASQVADSVKLWIFRPGQVIAAACLKPGATCGEGATGVVSFDGAASTATYTTEPFPRGPSAAEAEAARLAEDGAFSPAASQGSLLGLANAADPEVRARALQALAIQNSAAGVQAIIAALEDPEPLVRGEALHMAMSIGTPGPEAIAQLRDLLDHKDPGVRFAAAMALGEQPGAEAEFQLRRALGDPDESVKNAAAQVLRQKNQQRSTQKRK